MLVRPRSYALLPLLALCPFATESDAAGEVSITVHSAASCLPATGLKAYRAGPLAQMPPVLIGKDYHVGGTGLIRAPLDQTATSPDDNIINVYCPIELEETTTAINFVDVGTVDNGFVPPELLPPGYDPLPYVSCRVVVATVDGCEGPIVGGTAPCDAVSGDGIPHQLFATSPSPGVAPRLTLTTPIPIAPWPQGGWRYAVLTCRLAFGGSMFNYEVAQEK